LTPECMESRHHLSLRQVLQSERQKHLARFCKSREAKEVDPQQRHDVQLGVEEVHANGGARVQDDQQVAKEKGQRVQLETTPARHRNRRTQWPCRRTHPHQHLTQTRSRQARTGCRHRSRAPHQRRATRQRNCRSPHPWALAASPSFVALLASALLTLTLTLALIAVVAALLLTLALGALVRAFAPIWLTTICCIVPGWTRCSLTSSLIASASVSAVASISAASVVVAVVPVVSRGTGCSLLLFPHRPVLAIVML
jgi:hypothetical protein